MSAYADLEARCGRLMRLDDAIEVLHWDMAAMMPAGGSDARAEQLATLSVLRHELATDAKLGELIAAAEGEALDEWQAANLRRIGRRFVHDTALPAALVEAVSRATSTCERVWRSARAANDFAGLRPHLETVVALAAEAAAAKGEALGLPPYEALLDAYDPGRSVASVDALFGDLATWLPGLIDAVIARQAKRPAAVAAKGPFPAEKQAALGRRVMAALGFDFEHGRLDTSHHPFCGGAPDDVRITTRYDEQDPARGLLGVVHETGHALYERGLPAAWRYQPVGRAGSMAIHESQSLFMEMQVGRGRGFIEFLSPLLGEVLGDDPAWAPDNLHRLYTRVERGLIRVDADEVTYPAHVVLRYRLERALMAGSLTVADLPEAWRAGMVELVGIAPPDDKDGCMQDIHWVAGLFGYFPTYTLGAMAAAQLFRAAAGALGDVQGEVAKGDFSRLRGWLGEHVHGVGSRLSSDALLTAATGAPLGTGAFRAHLEARYLG
ncbi:MAG: carboxypeptidase M32 [bacterium]